MGKNSKLHELEQWLKRNLKNRVSLNKAVVIAYLMAGFFGISNLTYSEYLFINQDTGATGQNTGGWGNDFAYPNKSVIIASTQGEDAVNTSKNKTALNSVIIGSGGPFPGSVATENSKYTYTTKENPRDLTVLGNNIVVNGDKITAIGRGAQVSGDRGVAVGESASVTDTGGTAIGQNAKSAAQGTALGQNTTAANQSTAIGSDVYATGLSAVAIGNDDISQKKGTGTTLVNSEYRDKLPEATIKRIYYDYDGGYNPNTIDNSTTALAGGVTKETFNQRYIQDQTQDQRIYSPTFAKGLGAIAIGSRSVAYDEVSTALGTLSMAFAPKSTAIGIRSFTDFGATGSLAVGEETRAFAGNNVSIGNRAETNSVGSLVVGANSISAGIGSVSIGQNILSNAQITNDSVNNIAKRITKQYFTGQDGNTQGYLNSLTENYSPDMNYGEYMNADMNPIVVSGFQTNQNQNKLKNMIQEVINGTTTTTTTTGLDANQKTPLNGALNIDTVKDSNVVLTVGDGREIKKTMKKGDNAISIGYYVNNMGDNSIGLGTASLVLGSNSVSMGSLNFVADRAFNAVSIGTGANVRRENSVAIGTGATSYGAGSVIVGSGALGLGLNTVSLGYGAITEKENTIALGNTARASQNSSMALGTKSRAENLNSIALGVEASATLDNSTAIGKSSKTDYNVADLSKPGWIAPGAVSIPTSVNVGIVSVGSIGQERRITNVASGYKDTDAVNVAQLRTAVDRFNINSSDDTTLHFLSVNRKGNTTIDNYEQKKALKTYINLLGYKGQIEIRKAVGETIDQSAIQNIDNKIADLEGLYSNLRNDAKAMAIRDVTQNMTSKDDAGKKALFDVLDKEVVKQTDAVNGEIKAIEQSQDFINTNYANNRATGENSIALGILANSPSKRAVAIGMEAKVDGAGSDEAIAIGDKATAGARGAIAIGGSLSRNNYSDNTNDSAKATGKNSISLGVNANTDMEDSIVIGKSASIQKSSTSEERKEAIAIGAGAIVTNKEAIAIGAGSNVGNRQAIAIGKSSTVTGNEGIAIGHRSKAEYNSAIAIGTYAGTINGKSDARDSVSIGTYATAKGHQGVSIGDQTEAAMGSVALGGQAKAYGATSLALGKQAQAYGKDNIAIGLSSAAGSNQTGKGATEWAVVIGNMAKAYSTTTAKVTDAVVVGGNSQVTASSGIAIGNGANANIENSIAIGKGSYTNNIAKGTYSQFAGNITENSTSKANSGSFAIGNNATITRQIQGVAAGTLDTDAVNVHQLKNMYLNITTQVTDGAETPVANVNLFTNPLVFKTNGDISIMADNTGTGTSTNKLMISLNGAISGANMTFKDNNNGKITLITKNSPELKIQEAAIDSDYKGTNLKVSVGQNGTDKNLGLVKIGLKESPEFKSMTFKDNNTNPYLVIQKDGAANTGLIKGLTDRKADTATTDYGTGENAGRAATEGAVLALKNSIGKLSSKVKYRANSTTVTTDIKEVSLSDGLDFINGNNTTASVEDNGKIKFDVNQELKGITSIASAAADPKTMITLDTTTNKVNVNGAKITGLADGELNNTSTDAVTGKQLFNLESKLGLNDNNEVSILDKVETLTNGTAGNLVYTDSDGNRVEAIGGKYFSVKKLEDSGLKKAKDGKFYLQADLTPDGIPLANKTPQTAEQIVNLGGIALSNKEVQLSTVNADGTTTTPTDIRNVASVIAPQNLATLNKNLQDAKKSTSATKDTDIKTAEDALITAAKNSTNTLFEKNNGDLNRVVTVGDLQSLAIAGLDFGANGTATDETIHRKLGEKLDIKGASANKFDATFSSDNIATKTTATGIEIGFKNKPNFSGLTLKSTDGATADTNPTISIIPGTDGALTLSKPGTAATTAPVELKGVETGTTDNSAVNKKQLEDALSTSLNNTISLGVDNSKATATQQLNKVGGIKFDILGTTDITTSVATTPDNKVTISLNKATTVSASDEKAVTSRAVAEHLTNNYYTKANIDTKLNDYDTATVAATKYLPKSTTINLKGSNGESGTIALNVTKPILEIVGGNTNITTASENNKFTISIVDRPTFSGGLVAGDVTITPTDKNLAKQVEGLTGEERAEKLKELGLEESSLKGIIHANGYKIAHIADGEVAAGSKAAVNGGQLFTVKETAEQAKTQAETNAGNISTNSQKITTVEGKVSKNEGDITTLKGKVTANETNIGTLQGKVSANETNISTNSANIEKGIKISATNAEAGVTNPKKLNLGDTITISQGDNITTTLKSNGSIEVALKNDLSFKTTGTSGLNGTPLTINSNNSGKISGLANGISDSDAINLGQIKPLATALNMSYKADGTIDKPSYTVGSATHDNIQSALNAINTTASAGANGKIVFANGSTTVDIPLNQTINFNIDDAGNTNLLSISLNEKTKEFKFNVSNSPTFTGSVKANGFDANNAKISNVSAGSLDGDAVNFKQLKDVKDLIGVSSGNTVSFALNAPVAYQATINGADELVVKAREATSEAEHFYKRTDIDATTGRAKASATPLTNTELGTLKIATLDENQGITKTIKFTNLSAGGINDTSKDAIIGAQLKPVLDVLGMTSDINNTVQKPEWHIGRKTYDSVASVITDGVTGKIGTTVLTTNTGEAIVRVGDDFFKVSELDSTKLAENKISLNATLQNEINTARDNAKNAHLAQNPSDAAGAEAAGEAAAKAKKSELAVKSDDIVLSVLNPTVVGSSTTTALKLSNIADGVRDNDAVNLSQLKKLGLDPNATTIKPVVTYDNDAKNIITLGIPASPGVTPTKTKITNLADGDITSAISTDAVTGGQLFTTNTKVSGIENDITNRINNAWNVVVNGSAAQANDKVNFGDTVDFSVGNNFDLNKSKTGTVHKLELALKDNLTIGGLKIKNVKNTTTGATPAYTQTEITGLTNTTWNGTAITSGRAATEDQLQSAIQNVNTEAGKTDAFAVKYAPSTADNTKPDYGVVRLTGENVTEASGTINKGTLLTNLKAGKVGADSTDAVNGSQLHNYATALNTVIGGAANVGNDGLLKPGFVFNINDNNGSPSTVTNVKEAIESLNNGWRVLGGTTPTGSSFDGVAGATNIKRGQSLGIVSSGNISTKVEKKVVTTVPKYEFSELVINNGKLYQKKDVVGGNLKPGATAIEGKVTLDDGSVLNYSDIKIVGDNIYRATDATNTTALNVAKVEGSPKTNGIAFVDIQLTPTPTFDNVTATKGGFIANGYDSTTKTATGKNISINADGQGFITGLENIKLGTIQLSTLTSNNVNTTLDITTKRAATEDQLKEVVVDYIARTEKEIEFIGDVVSPTGEKSPKIGLGQAINIKGGQNDTSKLTDSNIGVVTTEGTKTLTVKLAKELSNIKSIGGETNDGKLSFGHDTSGTATTPTINANNAILKGLAVGDTPDSAVTKQELQDLAAKVGAEGATGQTGPGGRDGSVGPAGKDGLNGTNGKDVPNLSEKVNALRAGEAGTLVYTTANGDRVVRDGANFYKASDLAGKVKHNGQWYNVNAEGKPDIDAGAITSPKAIAPADVQLSAVNPDGTTTNKTVLGNIAGNIALTGTTGLEEEAAKKITSLVGKTGSELDRVATVGDLKTLAVAGMNFGANGTTSTADNATHKKLGEKLSILGGTGNYFDNNFESSNLVTKVAAGNIEIGMKKTPKFTGVELQEDTTKPTIKLKPTGDGTTTSPATLTLEKDGTTPADKTVVLSGLKDSPTDDTSAVTRGAFKGLAEQTKEILDKTGLNGTDGNSITGPAGKDGLNGTTIVEKITSLRNGAAGNLVYVNADGDRVVRDGNKFYLGGSVKAKDGNWYPKGTTLDPVTGNPTDPTAQALTGIDPTDVQLAAVSPNGDTKATPTTIGNVKGTLADKVNAPDYATTGALKTATDALNTAEASTSSTKDTDIKNAIENLADARLGGLLKASGEGLNKVATVGDLQVLAKNGLEFIANGNATAGSKGVTKSLGSRIGVLGGEEYDVATFTGSNIATMIDVKGDILVGMKKVPIFEGLGLQAPNAGGTANPIVSLTPDANGDLNLSKPGTTNPTGGIVPGTDKVVLTGLADGTTPDSAVTKGALDALVAKAGLDGTNGNAGPGGRDIVGTPGATGATGATGPAGKDGLSGTNGKDAPNLSEKINALRAGEAGSMVYTDADGNRVVRDGDTFYKAADVANLVKDADGNWYAKDADGKPDKAGGAKTPTALTADEASKIQLTAVDKDGSTTKPTVMGNIASTIAPNNLADLNTKLKNAKTGGVDATIKGAEKALVDGAKDAITGTNGLYNKTDAKDLAKAATVGDLQSLAIAGLDFGANGTASNANNETHKKIGEKLSILGGAGNYFDNNFVSSNLVTKVADGNIEIGFKKTPEFAGIVIAKDGVPGRDGKDAVLTVDDKGNLIVKNGANGANGINGTDGKYSEIITKDAIEGIVGKTDGTGVLGSNGRDGLAGPAGKDGLNGIPGKDAPSLTDKINALRNGEAGTVVYTDNKGNRVVRDGDTFYNADKIKDYVKVDGKFYEKSNVENGVPKAGAPEVSVATLNSAKVAKENIELSAVSPDGGTKTATPLGNVASAIMEKANTVKVAETAVDNANKELTDVASEVATAAADVEMKKAALAKAEKDAGANVATDPAVAAAKTALQNAKTALTGKITELGNKQVALQNAENNLENAISGLAAINAENAKDVVLGKANAIGTREGGLLEASGAVLNKVATVGDLQAVAQAGLDFESNDGSGTNKTIHKTLGSTLKIEGEKGAKFDDGIYSSENLVTRNDNGILRLAMLKTPIFDGIELVSANGNSKVSMIAENDGSLNLANNIGNVVIKGVKDGDTDDSVVTKGTLDKVIKGGFKIRLGGDDSKVINIGLGDTLDLGAGANIVIAGKNKGTSSPIMSVMGDGTTSATTSTTLTSGTANITMAGGTGAGTGSTNIVDTIPGIEDSTTPNATLGFQLSKEVKFNEVVIEKDGDQNSTKTVINNNGVNVTNKEGDKTVITPNNVETSTVVAKNEVKVEAGKDKSGKDVPGTTTVINKDGGVTVSTITKITDKDTGKEVVKETAKVTINDGAISGLKDVALDENGMVAEKEQDKAVNGGTLNQSMTILREQVSGGLSQVNDRIINVEKRVQKVERNLQRGIANSVAQAGVKFQEIGKNQAVVGAAIGSYKGQQAVAVGVQAAPTENVRVHGIISVSPTDVSESAVSVGASWKFNLK